MYISNKKTNNMTLKEKIAQEFITAYKNKDFIKKDLLNVVKAEIQRKEAGKIIFQDKDIIQLIKKMIEDLQLIGTEQSKIEINILSKYIPQQMEEDEIISLIKQQPFNNLGECMKFFSTHYAGQYNGKQVSEIFNTHFNS